MTVRQVVGLDDTGSSETDDLVTTYEYDTRGLLIETREKRVDYDGTSMADIVTMFTYADTASCGCGGSFNPRIETITYAVGTALQATVAWEFDTNGNPTSFTDEVGRKTLLKYDALDRLVETISPDPDGVGTGAYRPVMQYVYTGTGRIKEMIETSVDDPEATTPQYGPEISTIYLYDFRGRLVEVIENFQNGIYSSFAPDEDIITELDYDAAGNLTKVTDPLDRETEFYYDLLNRPTRVTEPDPDGGGPLAAPVSYLVYDATGRVRAERDPRGSVTNYVYDQSHRLTATRTMLANSQQLIANSFTYDSAGQLTSVTDPEGRQTRYTYDDAGRLIELIPPLANSQQLTANSYSYDTLSNLRVVTDQLGHETEYVYDARYRLTEEIDANGDATTYTYFDDNQLHTLTDAEQNTTTWAYDNLGRVASETNELNDSRTYEYDEFSRLIQMTDRNERVTEYDYDGLHRLTEERWLDGMSTVHTISYDYDQASQLTDVSDAFADYHYDYDDLGRATTIIADLAGLTDDVVLTQDFDPAGLRTQLAAQIGTTDDFVNDYAYDQLGRMTRIEQHGVGGGNSVAEKRVDFAYNRASQFDTISRYADLAGTEFVAESAFEYDGRGRLVGLVHNQDTTTFADYGWTYDAADRMTAMTNSQHTAENVTYSYDDRGQLTGADYASLTDETYTYDDNGNRTGSGLFTGPNNRLSTAAGHLYAYDDEGNLVYRENAANGHRTIYEWDHRNRLMSVTDIDNTDAQTLKVTYNYDAFNRLVERTYQETSGGPISKGYFIYDGIEMILALDDSGDVEHRLLWGPAVDQALADEDAAGNTYWYFTDHLGTVRDIGTYNAGTNTTTIANHIVYDSYGRRTSETNSSLGAFDIGYTGKWLDRDTGLKWHWNRWYNPEIQRWMSEDFIWDGANKYSYVGNMPTGYVDSNGLQQQEARPVNEPPQFQLPAGFQGGHIIINTPVRLDPRVIEEINRILAKAIEDFGDPTNNCLVATQSVTQLSREQLRDNNLLGRLRWSDPQLITYSVLAIPNQRIPRGIAISGVDSFQYHPQRIRDAARDRSQPTHIAMATVFAHEIILHLIGGFAIHPTRSGYIDSPYGETGGSLSPDACRAAFDVFDIDFRRNPQR
jgi:RHS repeat-associated protein